MNHVTKLIRAELALQRWELRLGRALRQVLRLRRHALHYRAKCAFPYLGAPPKPEDPPDAAEPPQHSLWAGRPGRIPARLIAPGCHQPDARP